jgi:hypothetical protein
VGDTLGALEFVRAFAHAFCIHTQHPEGNFMKLFRLSMGIWLLASGVVFAGDTSPPTPRDPELEKAKLQLLARTGLRHWRY